MRFNSVWNALRPTAVVIFGLGYAGEGQAQTSVWTVSALQDAKGETTCLADTHDENVGVGFAMQKNGDLKMIVKRTSWKFERSITGFWIVVDGKAGWAIDGAIADGNSTVFVLPNNDGTVEMLQAIMNGSELQVVSKSKKAVVTVGLKGSESALKELADCARQHS